MKISNEAVVVEATDGLVRIEYRATPETAAGSFDLKREVWIEEATAVPLSAAIAACLHGKREVQAIDVARDAVKVYEAGNEASPYVHVENERGAGAAHAGTYWIAMQKGAAEQLAFELMKLP